MSSLSSTSLGSRSLAVLFGLLWLHLFFCLSPAWDSAGYYGYGWLVAPAALFFGWRRIGLLREEGEEPRPDRSLWPVAAGIGLLLLLMPALRMVEIGDPTWRVTFILHALLLAGLSHFALARSLGWKRSLWFAPLTLFALSAVPYPWQVEQNLIRQLTGGVIQISGELFNLSGRPVTVHGETLESMGTIVEVTEGCSGIRSFQALIATALFFGELSVLAILPRFLLIVLGIACSVVMNTIRAMTLARIRWDEGEAAFDAAHDNIGFLAFGVASVILLVAARLLTDRPERSRKVVRRSVVQKS